MDEPGLHPPTHWHAEHSEFSDLTEKVGFTNPVEANILAHKWLEMALRLGMTVTGRGPWMITIQGHAATIEVKECTNPNCKAKIFHRRTVPTGRNN